MTSRARRPTILVALVVIGCGLLWTWRARPHDATAAGGETRVREGRVPGGSAASTSVESDSPASGVGSRPRPRGTQDSTGSVPPPGGSQTGPSTAGSAGSAARTPDAGVGSVARLAALLFESGLVDDERKDPQLSAFEQLAALPEGAPFGAITREGRVVEARGEAPVANGSACQVRVLPARKDGFDCAVLVMCASVIVYPDPRAAGGLNACVYGEDGSPRAVLDQHATSEDGDPTLVLDLGPGQVEVGDSAPEFALRIALEGSASSGSLEPHE